MIGSDEDGIVWSSYVAFLGPPGPKPRGSGGNPQEMLMYELGHIQVWYHLFCMVIYSRRSLESGEISA